MVRSLACSSHNFLATLSGSIKSLWNESENEPKGIDKCWAAISGRREGGNIDPTEGGIANGEPKLVGKKDRGNVEGNRELFFSSVRISGLMSRGGTAPGSQLWVLMCC